MIIFLQFLIKDQIFKLPYKQVDVVRIRERVVTSRHDCDRDRNFSDIILRWPCLKTFSISECNKPVNIRPNILQQTCYQQADIRMRSPGLRQLVDDKSVASCQQTCCKLFVKTLLSTGVLQVVSTI